MHKLIVAQGDDRRIHPRRLPLLVETGGNTFYFASIGRRVRIPLVVNKASDLYS